MVISAESSADLLAWSLSSARAQTLALIADVPDALWSSSSDAVRSIGASGLAQPTPDPALASTQPTLGHHLNALLIHEGYHAGQLSVWRRLCGLPPTPWCLAPRDA